MTRWFQWSNCVVPIVRERERERGCIFGDRVVQLPETDCKTKSHSSKTVLNLPCFVFIEHPLHSQYWGILKSLSMSLGYFIIFCFPCIHTVNFLSELKQISHSPILYSCFSKLKCQIFPLSSSVWRFKMVKEFL